MMCIQEARASRGILNALKAEAQAFGYNLHSSHNGELAVYVLNGVNYVPLASRCGDEPFHLARYGLEVAGERLLICNIHGHPHHAATRHAMMTHLMTDIQGDTMCAIGDFNEHLKPHQPLCDLWPDDFTFRQNPQSETFVSSPDGALLSSRLAHVAAIEAIHNAGAHPGATCSQP